MQHFQRLADANSPSEVWAREHPFLLGLIVLFLGGVLVLSGVTGLRSGRATNKWAFEMTGGMAATVSTIRLLIGVGVCLFGLSKMVAG